MSKWGKDFIAAGVWFHLGDFCVVTWGVVLEKADSLGQLPRLFVLMASSNFCTGEAYISLIAVPFATKSIITTLRWFKRIASIILSPEGWTRIFFECEIQIASTGVFFCLKTTLMDPCFTLCDMSPEKSPPRFLGNLLVSTSEKVRASEDSITQTTSACINGRECFFHRSYSCLHLLG